MDAEELVEPELTAAPPGNRFKPPVAPAGGNDFITAGLAAERTLLAWVRTSLAMMGFGFIVAKFSFFLGELTQVDEASIRPISDLSLWIGGSLVVLGVVVNVVAATSHVQIIRRLLHGKHYRVSAWSFGVFVTLTVAMIGVLLTVYLYFWSQ